MPFQEPRLLSSVSITERLEGFGGKVTGFFSLRWPRHGVFSGLLLRLCRVVGIVLALGGSTIISAQLSLVISDDNYDQPTNDFSVPVGVTLTNTVTWTAVELEGRGGLLFLRSNTGPTVELLPADLTVIHGGSVVPAIKVGFSSIEYHVAMISDLGTGGTIDYSVTFNKDMEVNNSRIGIHATGQPFVASNELFHRITATPPVQIDVKPGSDPNSINPRGKGVLPVAILTTDVFDAATVSAISAKFGPGKASMTHRSGHLEGVDGDGDLDLVLHFRTSQTGMECGDTEALLTAETFDGQQLQASDSIVTRGCR